MVAETGLTKHLCTTLYSRAPLHLGWTLVTQWTISSSDSCYYHLWQLRADLAPLFLSPVSATLENLEDGLAAG